MILSGKTITVGITGGIAAYKACDIVSRLKKLGANVFVVMTQNAAEFVCPLTFETLSGNPVITQMFGRQSAMPVEHISLAKKSDLFLLAPCAANMAAKLANGIADDFLSTTTMAATCPVMIAPAMNTAMYQNPAYKHNESVLRERGFLFVDPDDGRLACGDSGKGRLASIDTIIEAVCGVLGKKQDFSGKKVLVTAGSTREYLDPVRFITNRSSGKMGIEIAKAACLRGAKVTLVAGIISATLPDLGLEIIRVETTDQMLEAVTKAKADYYIMAAAPADYAAPKMQKNKIKGQILSLNLTKNPDIAAKIGAQKKPETKLVIFAAETENLTQNARKKLDEKGADMVVANNVLFEGAGFDVDTNVATIITKTAEKAYSKMPKSQLAGIILDTALTLETAQK